MRSLPILLAAFLLPTIAVQSHADEAPPDDWPQILGPGRDGRYLGPSLAKSWPAGGPQDTLYSVLF